MPQNERDLRSAMQRSVESNNDRDSIVDGVNDHMDEELPDLIAEGFARAMRELLKDEKFMAEFWSQGYRQFSESASTSVKLWIGARVLYLFIAAAFAAALAWAVTGKVGK